MDAQSIYVHIPFCKARCGYCAFSSCVDFSLQEQYFATLVEEIRGADISFGSAIKTMYWGGGTPSAVSTKYLETLFDTLSRKFDFSRLEEFTAECNPESATKEKLSFFRSIGVNRLSFGLQSANDETLKKIGRLHTYEVFLRALDCALSLGFKNIGADLILGLPEDIGNFRNSVEKAVRLPLKHISLYALEIHDENKAFKALCEAFPHDDDEMADMYDFALEKFEEHGFSRYEVSNFAKEGYCSKHNLTYWTEGRYYGFGASASGFLGNTRYGNAFDIKKYIETNAEFSEYRDEISPEEEMKEFVMLNLRLSEGFDAALFTQRFGCEFFRKFHASEFLLAHDLLSFSEGRIRVPSNKFYVLNSILAELL